MSVPYGQPEPTVTAGWYQDPHDGAGHRWWDGTRWTEHTQPEPGRAAEPWTAPAVSSGHGQPGHDAVQPYQGAVQTYPGVADAGQYPAFPAAGAGVGSGFAPAYPPAGASGMATFGSPGFASAGPVYPGAVTGYPTSGWSGYETGPITKPTNGLATGALVAGVVVIAVLVVLNYAIVSGIAVIVGVRAVQKARAIKAGGYPTAVGMGRAVTGLVLSSIGALLYVMSMFGG